MARGSYAAHGHAVPVSHAVIISRVFDEGERFWDGNNWSTERDTAVRFLNTVEAYKVLHGFMNGQGLIQDA